jgi:hypothetical protein
MPVQLLSLLCRWAATGIGMLTMVLLGEWLCVRREMQDIPISESSSGTLLSA